MSTCLCVCPMYLPVLLFCSPLLLAPIACPAHKHTQKNPYFIQFNVKWWCSARYDFKSVFGSMAVVWAYRRFFRDGPNKFELSLFYSFQGKMEMLSPIGFYSRFWVDPKLFRVDFGPTQKFQTCLFFSIQCKMEVLSPIGFFCEFWVYPKQFGPTQTF